MGSSEITALVLAAGSSGRMGQFKPLLDLGGQPVIARVIESLAAAGIADIRVVTGYGRELLRPVLEKVGVRAIVNESYAEGMFSSVLAGVNSLGTETRAFFVLPADVPLVRPSTIRRLAGCLAAGEKKILLPFFKGRRGHPPLIPSGLAQYIKEYRGDRGLCGFVEAWGHDTLSIEVPDENIRFDVDRPGDYDELKRRWERRGIPTVEECEIILTDVCRVEEPVLRHCRAVADLAGTITDWLNEAGCSLDRDLVVAASLLHDIARGKPDHAAESALIARNLGFDGAAGIIETHMDIVLSERGTVGPDEVLYLADKLVSGDRWVTLSERLEQSVSSHGDSAEARRNIEARFDNARIIGRRIDALTGGRFLDLQHALYGGPFSKMRLPAG
jgi:molybdenum cofactor cytidylyltransferase